RGNNAYLLAVFSRSEGNVQQPACLCLSQCVISRFALAVSHILKHEYRCAEKYLFRLALTYIVFFLALALVSFVPVESFNLCEIQHQRVYYYNIRDSAKDPLRKRPTMTRTLSDQPIPLIVTAKQPFVDWLVLRQTFAAVVTDVTFGLHLCRGNQGS